MDLICHNNLVFVEMMMIKNNLLANSKLVSLGAVTITHTIVSVILAWFFHVVKL
jgi:hypothetical protein